MLLMAVSAACAQPYVIDTIAGGVPPKTPVAASDASMSPNGIAVDTRGNVFFSGRNAIFKVDAKGVLTLVAGNSRPGFSGDGGPAVAAQLNSPGGMAVDRAGNLYVADTGNNRVRRVSTDGVVTTVAGGGPDAQARLYGPAAVAIDSAGNLYIADNQAIRKLAPGGSLTSVAACPICAVPAGGALSVDSSDNVYVGSYGNAWKISPAGATTLMAGASHTMGPYSGEGGPATAALFDGISGIAAGAHGEIYLTDKLSARVLRIAADGTIHTITASIAGPGSLAVDAAGNLYVAEWSNIGPDRRIVKIAPDGTIANFAGTGVEEYSGDGPAAAAQLDAPWGVAADTHGNLYITDSGNHTVRKIDLNGVISTVAGTGTAGDSGDSGPAARAQLNQPLGIAVDGAGNLFIAECLGARIRKVSADGIITTVAGGNGPGYAGDGGPAAGAKLACPHGVAVDGAGNIYIADTNNQRLRKVTTDGVISTIAGGGPNASAAYSGPALDGQLWYPTSLALDFSGNLYVADTGSGRIRKIGTGGIITTVAGGGQYSMTNDNDGIPATTAVLNAPQGVAVDAAGNLYMGDTQSDHVRRVSPSGIISTIAGRGLDGYLSYSGAVGPGYSGDGGPAMTAQLAMPYGVAVGASLNVYVADLPNAAVRVLRPMPIANAASSLYGPIAPGEIVTIYGSMPAGSRHGCLEARATFNGVAAQVVASSATQVSTIVPPVGGDTAKVEVQCSGKTALSFSVPVAAVAPALFTADSTGRGLAAALNADGSYNSMTASAAPGDFITLFANGAGFADQAGAPVTVTIGGQTAEVWHVEPDPARPGVSRIYVKVPANATANAVATLQTPNIPVPVVLQVGGVSSQPGVYITVFTFGLAQAYRTIKS